MSKNRTTQSLSYPLRIPEGAQENALRLLDVSRSVINTVITNLWPRLDEFTTRTTSYAYKQVEAMMVSPLPHGNRQYRCEAEQAGRILRAQAARKQQFALILPLLSQGMIRLPTEKLRAGKERVVIKQALADFKKSQEDGGNSVELQSLIEQACNYYLKNGCFPDRYEDMQEVPIQQSAQLPYAGDDGGEMGQTYTMGVDLDKKQITLALRCPDAAGKWERHWRERLMTLSIPDYVLLKIKQGSMQAPVLREIKEPGGTRYAVLDLIVEVPITEVPEPVHMSRILGFDWGVRTLLTTCVVDLDGHQLTPPLFLDTGCFDGKQARTRRQIDQLKAKVARLEAQRDRFPVGDPRREPGQKALSVLRKEISQCWRKYEARNHDLAHLASNILLVLAATSGCELIAGESLKSMKSQRRGRDTKSKWRNWRNNSQIRGVLWQVLKYKCFLTGVHLFWQQPRGTSHTCPRCTKAADTYKSPEHLSKIIHWGAWLRCKHCGWSGSRDYAAALNIARLGAASLEEAQRLQRLVGIRHPQISEEHVKPVSYIGTGALLRFPAPSPRARLFYAGKMYCNGWLHAVTLHSSYPTDSMIRLCGERMHC